MGKSNDGPGLTLNLSGLAVRHLSPTTMCAAFGVRVLNLEGNSLQVFGAILLLHSLIELNVSKNRLVADVAEAYSLPHLRRLDVSGNNMALKGLMVPPSPHLTTI